MSKITNVSTGVSRETVSASDGSFRIDAVDPGNYKEYIGPSAQMWRRAINGLNDSVEPRELEQDTKQAASEFKTALAKDPLLD